MLRMFIQSSSGFKVCTITSQVASFWTLKNLSSQLVEVSTILHLFPARNAFVKRVVPPSFKKTLWLATGLSGVLDFFIAKKIADGRHTFFLPEALREGSSATSSSALWTRPSFARDSAPVCGRSTVFFCKTNPYRFAHLCLVHAVHLVRFLPFSPNFFPYSPLPVVSFFHFGSAQNIRRHQKFCFLFSHSYAETRFSSSNFEEPFPLRSNVLFEWVGSPFCTTLFMYKAPLSAPDCEV